MSIGNGEVRDFFEALGEIPKKIFVEQCRQHNDWAPIAFEWYKYAIQVCIMVTGIEHRQSMYITERKDRYYEILRGLFCRCIRIMTASIKLTENGQFGEVFFILQRCIIESLIRIKWLIVRDDEMIYNLFISSGLKSDIRVLNAIRANIDKRKGDILDIENRMINSIEKYLFISGVDESTVSNSKNIPKFYNTLEELGAEELYLFLYGMQSHGIHGNWSDLITNYLEYDGNHFNICLTSSEVRPDQYLIMAKIVINIAIDYIEYIVSDQDIISQASDIINSAHGEIDALLSEIIGTDFNCY